MLHYLHKLEFSVRSSSPNIFVSVKTYNFYFMFKAYFDIQEYELARVVITYYFNLLSKNEN